MKRLIYFLIVGVISTVFSSCKEDDDPPPVTPTPSNYQLNYGEGALEVIDEDTDIATFTLLLSNVRPNEAGAFSSAGQALYLKLEMPSDNIFLGEEVILPAGTYDISGEKFKIIRSSDTRFVHLDTDGKGTTYSVTSGSITVARSGSTYNITGKLESSQDSVFSFKFGAPITIENNYGIPTFDGVFTSASVYSRQEYYNPNSDNYIISLSTTLGHALNLEIVAPRGNSFFEIADGIYTFSSSQITTFNIIGGEESNMKLSSSADSDELTGGEFELSRNGTTYSISGKVENSKGEMNFTYNGEMKFDRLHVKLSEGFFNCQGFYYGRRSTTYLLEMYDSHSSGRRQNICFFVGTPVVYYNEWFPVADGTFGPWADDYHEAPLPWTYDTNEGFSPTEYEMHDSNDNQYVYSVVDGNFTTEFIEAVGAFQKYLITGSITTRNEDDELLYIDFEFDGAATIYVSNDAGSRSTITSDLNVQNLTKALASYNPEYWEFDGGATTASTRILMTTDDGDFEEYDGDENTHYVQIDISFDRDAPWQEIIPGKYVGDPEWTFDPFTFTYGSHPGARYIQGSGYYDGVWDKRAYFSAARAGLGEVTISKEGNIYTLEFDCYDDTDQAHHVWGKFVGEIPVVYEPFRSFGMRNSAMNRKTVMNIKGYSMDDRRVEKSNMR